jgi:hypothetical protein
MEATESLDHHHLRLPDDLERGARERHNGDENDDQEESEAHGSSVEGEGDLVLGRGAGNAGRAPV